MNKNELNKNLFWEKYRPKKYENMVLLKRIKDQMDHVIKNGLDNHYLFVGDPALGKTTLANIITNRYKNQLLVIRSSKSSSVDVLRGTVKDFVNTYSGGLLGDANDFKVIYIEEFDGMSSTFKEALRDFIETYNNSVRFLFTCNEIDSIPKAILSRVVTINFNLTNQREKIDLIKGYKKYLTEINRCYELGLDLDFINQITEAYFPDFRKILNEFQLKHTNPTYQFTNNQLSIIEELYEEIINNKKHDKLWMWLKDNYYKDEYKVIKSLNGFIEYLLNKYPNFNNKIGKLTILIANYNHFHKNSLDPFINVFACIVELQETLYE